MNSASSLEAGRGIPERTGASRGRGDVAQVDGQGLVAEVAGADSPPEEVDALDLDVAGGEKDLLSLASKDGDIVADADDDVASGAGRLARIRSMRPNSPSSSIFIFLHSRFVDYFSQARAADRARPRK